MRLSGLTPCPQQAQLNTQKHVSLPIHPPILLEPCLAVREEGFGPVALPVCSRERAEGCTMTHGTHSCKREGFETSPPGWHFASPLGAAPAVAARPGVPDQRTPERRTTYAPGLDPGPRDTHAASPGPRLGRIRSRSATPVIGLTRRYGQRFYRSISSAGNPMAPPVKPHASPRPFGTHESCWRRLPTCSPPPRPAPGWDRRC